MKQIWLSLPEHAPIRTELTIGSRFLLRLKSFTLTSMPERSDAITRHCVCTAMHAKRSRPCAKHCLNETSFGAVCLASITKKELPVSGRNMMKLADQFLMTDQAPCGLSALCRNCSPGSTTT